MAVRKAGWDEGEGGGGDPVVPGVALGDGVVGDYSLGFPPEKRAEDVRPESIRPPMFIVNGEEK